MNPLTRFTNAWKRIPKIRVTLFICAVAIYVTAAGYFGKLGVLAWLVVAAFATGFLMWLIMFRLQTHLISTGYQFIFASKFVAFVLCLAGLYLVMWPLPNRIPLVSRLWFSLFALVFILSDIGYYLYSRDVNASLKEFTNDLPVVPPTVSSDSPDREKEDQSA